MSKVDEAIRETAPFINSHKWNYDQAVYEFMNLHTVCKSLMKAAQEEIKELSVEADRGNYQQEEIWKKIHTVLFSREVMPRVLICCHVIIIPFDYDPLEYSEGYRQTCEKVLTAFNKVADIIKERKS